jgi:hypothetical protein
MSSCVVVITCQYVSLWITGFVTCVVVGGFYHYQFVSLSVCVSCTLVVVSWLSGYVVGPLHYASMPGCQSD